MDRLETRRMWMPWKWKMAMCATIHIPRGVMIRAPRALMALLLLAVVVVLLLLLDGPAGRVRVGGVAAPGAVLHGGTAGACVS